MITNKIVEITGQESELKKELLDFSSRYQKSKLIYYSNFNILTFDLYKRNFNPAVNEIPADIKYYLIKKSTEYKPWLVSDEAYSDPGYWWFIMEFNNIFDIEEFVAGITIQIPPLTYVG